MIIQSSSSLLPAITRDPRDYQDIEVNTKYFANQWLVFGSGFYFFSAFKLVATRHTPNRNFSWELELNGSSSDTFKRC